MKSCPQRELVQRKARSREGRHDERDPGDDVRPLRTRLDDLTLHKDTATGSLIWSSGMRCCSCERVTNSNPARR